MAAFILCSGLFLCLFMDIHGIAMKAPKTMSVNQGQTPFVFSAKNQFSFSKPSGMTNSGGSHTGKNQQQPWKTQIPINTEPNKNQNPGQQNNQQHTPQGQQHLFQNGQRAPGGFPSGGSMGMKTQFKQESFNHQPSNMNGFGQPQSNQQFKNMNQQSFPQNNQQQHPFNQPNNNSPNGHSKPFGQLTQHQQQQLPQYQQQQLTQHQQQRIPQHQQQQLPQHQQQQLPQHQQQQLPQHQQQQLPQHQQQLPQHLQQTKFNQFGRQQFGNGISVLSQKGPSNMPPYQTMNMMPQQGFQAQQPQGHMPQFNQPNRQFFNQVPGHVPGQVNNQMHGQPSNQMPGKHGIQISGPPHNPMAGQGIGQQGKRTENPTGQFTGPSGASPTGSPSQYPPPQGGIQGQGQYYPQNPNLAVIDHPVTTTTTPKPPTSTVDGEGIHCFTTADCEVGCCFNSTGQLLDTTTYGAGAPKEGRASGKCFIRSPGLGDVCDDLCPCQMGHECYRRYVPKYPKPGKKAPPPVDPEGAPKPQRKCIRTGVAEAEREAHWRCYFDVACSGPLP